MRAIVTGLLIGAAVLAAPYPGLAGEGLELRVAYRMVEGGADNDSVYSFAWFHYAVAGVGLSF